MNNQVRNKFSPRIETPPQPPGKSLTQQHFKEEHTMNNMVNKYLKGGRPPLNERQATFGDFASIDFQEMQNAIADINTQFAELPARLRTKFGNRPENLLRWLENPANQETAVKLGLITPLSEVYDPDKILQAHAQLDLEKEAQRLDKEAKKADPEAQPSHAKPAKTP
jgi:phage internal scaffolding protein